MRYFYGSTDITAAMRSTGGYDVAVGPGLSQVIRVEIKLKATAVAGTKKTSSVTAAWTGDRVIKDVVETVVKVRA